MPEQVCIPFAMHVNNDKTSNRASEGDGMTNEGSTAAQAQCQTGMASNIHRATHTSNIAIFLCCVA